MKYLIVFIFLSIGGGVSFLILSCSPNLSQSGVFESRSGSDAQERSGVFESSSGRLESEDVCFNNEDCVELCQSMLKKTSDQKACYEYAEKKVQSLRDIYNNLTIGSKNKLSEITPDEMEELLEFGFELWLDAISGFERDLKPGCTDNSRSCRGDDYYLQRGYTRKGAANALSWIARNDWLAELLLKYDKDHLVMLKLLDTLSEPTILPGYSSNDETKIKECPSTSNCANDLGLDVNCADNVSGNDKQIKAFLSRCLDDDHSYSSLSVRKNNPKSQELGEEVVEEICKVASCNEFLKKAMIKILNENKDFAGALFREILCQPVSNTNASCKISLSDRTDACSAFKTIVPSIDCSSLTNCTSGNSPTCN